MDLEGALADADAALEAAQRELEGLEERMDALQLERQGLRLALARHNGEPAATSDQEGSEWQMLPRTEAIIRVLQRTTEPLSPVEVTRQLGQLGRRDHGSAVSAALSYLRQKGEVESLGRGQWVLTSPSLVTADDQMPMLDSGPQGNGSGASDSNGSPSLVDLTELIATTTGSERASG